MSKCNTGLRDKTHARVKLEVTRRQLRGENITIQDFVSDIIDKYYREKRIKK